MSCSVLLLRDDCDYFYEFAGLDHFRKFEIKKF